MKRNEQQKGQKGEEFYVWKNDAVRWVYGRKERAKLRKEWDKAKELERSRVAEGEGRGASRGGTPAGGVLEGMAMDGRASASGSSAGNGKGSRNYIFRRIGGDVIEKSAV